MKIHIIATPRAGGTAYAEQLARKLNLPFINEPFKFNKFDEVTLYGDTKCGGGLGNAESYVAHHIISQYLSVYDVENIPEDHQIILIDRMRKWPQLLSYCIMSKLLDKYGLHNIEYQKEEILVSYRSVQRMVNEWTVMDIFKKLHPDLKFIYYEDIEFDKTSPFKKNKGAQNVTISNLNDVRKLYFNTRWSTEKNLQIKDEKLNVAFFVQSEMTWNCFSSIYEEMNSRDNVNAMVFAVPTYIDNKNTGPTDSGMTTDNSVEVLQKRNVNFIDLSLKDRNERIDYLKSLNINCVMSATKDQGFFEYPFGITVEEFAEIFKTVYVPYYGATIVNDSIFHTKSPGHKSFWRFVVDSDLYKQYFIEQGTPEEKIINLGHPKIEEIIKVRNIVGSWPLEDSEDKLKIIWAPHWSCAEYHYIEKSNWTNTLKFGTFLKNCEYFYNYAEMNEDTVQFVFRPHPLLQRWLRGNGVHQKFKSFYDKWKKLPNVYNQLTGLYNETFAASDLMITDGASFLTEYPLATGKPLIFIDSGVHAEFNEIAKTIEPNWNTVSNFSEIVDLLSDPGSLKRSDGTEIIKYLLPHQGETAKRIVDKLISDLLEE